jgi:N-methylhydantoinase B/oxoprolinase/acetone carboxylase alpha subunit
MRSSRYRFPIAANHVCGKELPDAEESDLENLDDLADQIIGLTEKSMREEIEKIPDGCTDEGRHRADEGER